MPHEVNVWLEDIKQAVEEIDSFLPEKKDFSTFKKDLKNQKGN